MTDLEFPTHLWHALNVLIEAYWLPVFCFGVLGMLADLKWSQIKLSKKMVSHTIVCDMFQVHFREHHLEPIMAAIKTKVLAKKRKKK